MASYQPQVIQEQPGFAQNLMGDLIRAFLSNKLKQGFDKQNNAYQEEQIKQFSNSPQFSPTTSPTQVENFVSGSGDLPHPYQKKFSYGPGGLSFTAEEQLPDDVLAREEAKRIADEKAKADALAAVTANVDKLKNDPAYNDYDKTLGYGASGPSISMSKKQPKPAGPINPDVAFKRVIGGYGSPEEEALIGQRSGVEKPPAEIPGMTMLDGSTGNIPNADQDWGKAIQQTLFPNYSREQVSADVAGLPQIKQPKEDVSDEFKSDLQGAIDASNDDEAVFTKHLQDLSRKYANDSIALKHIKELMAINKPAKQKKDLFGGTDWK